MKKILLSILIILFSSSFYGQALSAIINVQHVTCAGQSNGLIHVMPMGGVSPYNISWNGGSTYAPSNIVALTQIPAGAYPVVVKDATNSTYFQMVIVYEPMPLLATTSVNNDTITVNATGGTPWYQYALNGGPYINSNVFSNVLPGNYIISVRDSYGCMVDSNLISLKPAKPVINNPTQTFTQGTTLADIQVEGQNIKWYATQSGNKIASSELPLSTVLIDGTTYYVSQTVNSVESEKSEITVTVGALSNEDFAFQNLKLYPIPAKDILKVANKTIIKKVVIYNYLGAEVLSTSIDKTDFEVNLRTLYKGVYFVKLESQEGQKTIKIIKE